MISIRKAKLAGGAAALLALCALVTGCRHRVKAAPPVTTLAPALPLSTLANAVAPPEIPPASLPYVVRLQQPKPAVSETKPQEVESRRRRRREGVRRPTPAKEVANTPTPAPTGDMTPIGQISAAGANVDASRRESILNGILATERGLNGLHRPLGGRRKLTANQIRTFLAKARAALNQDDLDGALTLATKARVLLGELTSR